MNDMAMQMRQMFAGEPPEIGTLPPEESPGLPADALPAEEIMGALQDLSRQAAGLGQMIGVMASRMDAPITIERDAATGEAIGVNRGGRMLRVERDESGQITGLEG